MTIWTSVLGSIVRWSLGWAPLAYSWSFARRVQWGRCATRTNHRIDFVKLDAPEPDNGNTNYWPVFSVYCHQSIIHSLDTFADWPPLSTHVLDWWPPVRSTSEMTGDWFMHQIDCWSTDKFSVQSITWKIWLTYIVSCQIIVTNITNSTSTVTATSTGDLVFAFTGRYGSSHWFYRSLGRYGTSRHGSNRQLLFPRCIHLVHTWNRNCMPFLWALT